MKTPDWFPDELAHAGDEHLDVAYVEGYDAKAATDPADDVALFRARGLNDTHTLVDLGAGTGTLALAVAPFCQRVIAVDVSAAMLARLREKAQALGLRNVECVQGGFLSYEQRGEPVDFVYSRNALHHLPDFWKAIALVRIAALLRPGGVFRLRDLVYSFAPQDADAVIEAWLGPAPSDPARGWTRAELATHLRDEYSTYNWLLEPMLERAGFLIQEAENVQGSVFAAYTCVRN